jgi:zinc transport system substrate-binding protein
VRHCGRRFAATVFLACLVAGCAPTQPAGPQGASAAAGPLNVFVSILPEAYFVERIGGPYVTVGVLVGPGQSPHTFEPLPRQMVQVSEARLFFAIGWPFEAQILGKITSANPNLKVVDLRRGIALRHMTAEEEAADDDRPTTPNPESRMPNAESGDPDPHLWLSPRNAAIMAATMAQALAEADPAHADAFQRNLATVQADLARLDAQLAAALAPLKGKDFFVYHPAFGYFAQAYGLRQVPVEIEGKEPTARQLVRLIDRAKAEGVRVIFVQPQMASRSADRVAEAIGGAAVPMDDLAKDYIANLADMAEKVRKAMVE